MKVFFHPSRKESIKQLNLSKKEGMKNLMQQWKK
jgi:hypothetical protein